MMINDLFERLKFMFKKEVVFYGQYKGRVVDNVDEFSRGRVKVSIPDLGFNSDFGLWCEAEQNKCMIVPKIDDWIIVYFEAGKKNRPRYRGIDNSMIGMKVEDFDGQNTTNVLFQNGNLKIVYNEITGILNILNNNGNSIVELNGNTDYAVSFNDLKTGFDSLKTSLNSFITVYNAHTHSGVQAGGSSTASPSVPGVPATATIDAAKIDTLMVK
jgi:hypothetical protein